MLGVPLHVFKIVADKKSISQAAQELYMTQSAVSQQIQNLEAIFRVKLFDRLHRRIEITEAGLALYPYAAAFEKLHGEMSKTMQGLTDDVRGTLRIAASMTVGEYVLPDILVRFHRLFPQVDVKLEVCNSEQVIARVGEGSIDVGFIEGPQKLPASLVATPYGGDDLVVIRHTAEDSATAAPVSLASLLSDRWVMREATSGTRQFFEHFAAEQGVNPQNFAITMELGSTQAVKQAVKAGLGISPISRLAVQDEIARQELAVIPLMEGSIVRTFTMVYHADKFVTRAIEKFLQFAGEQIEQVDQNDRADVEGAG